MKLPKIKGKFVGVALWVAAGSVLVFGQVMSQTQGVKLNEPLERELESGQTHEYRLTLKAREFIQVRVEQKGIDVVLSIHSSDGKELSKMNSPNGKEGFETLSLIADNAGSYVVKINRLKETGNADRGKYGITLMAKRASTAQDIKRIEAEKQLFKVFQIRSKTTEEAQAEIEKYEALYPLWRELKDAYIVSLIERKITTLKSVGLPRPTETDAAASVNVTGKWNMIAEGDGQSMPVMIELKQDGETITGTFSSHIGNGTVPSGNISGNTITAIAIIEVQGQKVELKLKGKINGDKMSGSLSGAMLPRITFTATKAK